MRKTSKVLLRQIEQIKLPRIKMKYFQIPAGDYVDSIVLVRDLESLLERAPLIASDLDKELEEKRKIAQKHPDNIVEMSSFLERAAGLICFYQIIFDFFGNSPGGKSARDEVFGYVDTLVKMIEESVEMEKSFDTEEPFDENRALNRKEIYLSTLLLRLKEFSKRLKGEE